MAFDSSDLRALAAPITSHRPSALSASHGPAALILAAAALFADDVEACPTGYTDTYGESTDGYDCNSYDALLAMNPATAAIPSDGVLVLQVAHTGAWGQPVLDHAAITVTQNDVPVPGTIEPTPLTDWAVFRPQAAWTPGVHHLTATLNNPGLPVLCGGDMIPVDFEFTVEAEPAVDLALPTIAGDETLLVTPYLSLGSIACCPGFAPSEYQSGCGGSTVEYDPAQCAPVQATGALQVAMTGTPAATGTTAGQYYYTFAINGAEQMPAFDPFQFGRQDSQPFCASLTVHDFGTGDALVGPETCFGESVAAQLGGPYPYPPPADLVCALQQCAPTFEGWDQTMCTPYDPGEPPTTGDVPTTGDSPTSAGDGTGGTGDADPGEDDHENACAGCSLGDASGLGLLALGFVLPRRRRR